MAHASLTFWGPVIILDHQETSDVIDVAVTAADIVNRIGNALSDTDFAIVGFALQAIAFGISVNAAIIEEVDHGNDVYITSPWPALGTIIPTTYPAGVGLPEEWASKPSGEFRTNDASDLVRYTVEPNAIGVEAVEFRLQALDQRMWRKVLVIRDGLGGQWDVACDPSQGATSDANGLWADQVHNGQVLSLWKAKEFGIMTWVLDVGGLQYISPGIRVTFEWIND